MGCSCVQAEFESRCEMYEAQVTKMQRSLERGDTEKAKVEEELAKAMALNAQGDRQVTHTPRICCVPHASLICHTLWAIGIRSKQMFLRHQAFYSLTCTSRSCCLAVTL